MPNASVLMLVSLSVSVSGDVESSNSWDSSLACPHPSPSFLNNFLQSESFMDCKHLHLLQIICGIFSGFLDIYFCKQGLIFLGFWSHVSYDSCTTSLSVHPYPTFVVKSTIKTIFYTFQSLTLRVPNGIYLSANHT